MSTDVRVETVIRRPRGVVSEYATNWRNDPTWIRALSDVRLVTDGPFGVGSQVARVANFLGKRIEYVNEIVEHEPGERLVMKSVKAPFPMTVIYEFEDAGDGTRMRIHTQGDASGFYRLAGPVLARAVKRGIEGDLAKLKAVLEADD
jgi:uncharacterized membrane protein